MKRALSIIVLALFLVTMLPINAFAAENFSGNRNVTTVCPWENLSTRGTSSPTTAWNVVSQGPFEFQGKASYSRLYLNRLLYGDQYFKATITNRSSTNALVVNPHDSVNLSPYTIPAGTVNHEKSFMLASGKTYFCLSFEAPSDFQGQVAQEIFQ